MADPDETAESYRAAGAENSLLMKLKYAQATSRAALEAEFEQFGLTVPQFRALSLIDETPDISSAEMARCSYISPQAMITIVARLAAANLIRRAPASGGGRTLTLRLTPEGKKLLDRAYAHAIAIERYLEDVLGEDVRRTLLSALDTVTVALSQQTTITKSAPWDKYVPPGA